MDIFLIAGLNLFITARLRGTFRKPPFDLHFSESSDLKSNT